MSKYCAEALATSRVANTVMCLQGVALDYFDNDFARLDKPDEGD
jgi:hypothetical protein